MDAVLISEYILGRTERLKKYSWAKTAHIWVIWENSTAEMYIIGQT